CHGFDSHTRSIPKRWFVAATVFSSFPITCRSTPTPTTTFLTALPRISTTRTTTGSPPLPRSTKIPVLSPRLAAAHSCVPAQDHLIRANMGQAGSLRSEEHTSELQSHVN